jgi:Sugar phosphate isomerases/epimerases
MVSRRNFFKCLGAASAAMLIPVDVYSAGRTTKNTATNVRYCLNTSTLRGQKLDLHQVIEITAKAGYEGIELWVDDVKKYISDGKSLASLKKHLDDSRLTVENAIGFAQWIVDDDKVRKSAFVQMEEEMKMMSELGCRRIAAPPSGATTGKVLDLIMVAQRFRELVELGVKTGVLPQLEIWGASKNLSRLGQALSVVADASHPKARILADVYHMYRGGSGFDGLHMMNGTACEIFHMNDYPATPEREKMTDGDRVFPGDGIAPLKQIIECLLSAGGTKTFSLELFNTEYWKRDALEVAKEGLYKMKKIIE